MLVVASFADPLEKFAKDIPGNDTWWIPPASSDNFTRDQKNTLTFTFVHANLVRYKIDSNLKYLLLSKGPYLGIDCSNQRTYLKITGSLNTFDAQLSDNKFINKLDGKRDIFEFEIGKTFIFKEKREFALGARINSFSLESTGSLPSLFNGVPGLGSDEESNIGWNEINYEIAVNLIDNENSIILAVGNSKSEIDLISEAPFEQVLLKMRPSGINFGISSKIKLENEAFAQCYYRKSKKRGEHGVFKRDSRIGPLRTKNDSWQWGLKLSDDDADPNWSLHVIHGINNEGVDGSADLSSFLDPVFGIVSPRGHLDSRLKLEISSLIYNRNFSKTNNTDFTSVLGISHWKLNASMKTWESLIFGSAILNEKISALDTQTGWLGHIGLRVEHNLGKRDFLILNIGQTIPFILNKKELPEGPISPVLARKKSFDGGRYISISIRHEF